MKRILAALFVSFVVAVGLGAATAIFLSTSQTAEAASVP
jgi:hypothetical protein